MGNYLFLFFVFNSILHGIFLFIFIYTCHVPDGLFLKNVASRVPDGLFLKNDVSRVPICVSPCPCRCIRVFYQFITKNGERRSLFSILQFK